MVGGDGRGDGCDEGQHARLGTRNDRTRYPRPVAQANIGRKEVYSVQP
jgi:hypothetical protein